MSEIHHYVLSSRKLEEKDGKLTYMQRKISTNNGTDGALAHFNIGKYSIKDWKTDYPEFITNSNYPEVDHFENCSDGFCKPGIKTKALFEELFTTLKESDKMLYVYLYGFGNGIDSEIEKQVIPMTKRYYPHNENANSPIGKMLFLSWPSQDKWEYRHGEKEDVSTMGRLLAVFFLKLYHFVNDDTNPLFIDWQPKIVFHSQSMGCKILQTAVERINFMENANVINKNILDKFFHRIVMTGADLDVDALNDLPDNANEEIHQWTKRLILFSHSRDFALWVSRFIYWNGKRLGRHLNDKKEKLLPRNIELVELKNDIHDFPGHNYFTEKEEVAVKLMQCLNDFHFDGITLEDRGRKTVFNIGHDTFESAEWLH